MLIRPLKIEDTASVNKIRNYYLSTTNHIFRRTEKSYDDDLNFIKFLLENDFPAVVCLENNVVAGFAYVSPFRETDGYDNTMELSIYVSKDYTSKGIGGLMLDEIEKLSANKFHTIISVIASENKESIKFHTKKGFDFVGTMKEAGFLNGKYLDVTFMQKLL